MNRFRSILALYAAVTAFSPALAADIRKGEFSARPSSTSPLSLAPGETRLANGGFIYRPASLPPGPRPLLLLLHGHSHDNGQFIRMLEPWADRCGVIVFAPRARRITWDIIANAKRLERSRSAPTNAPREFGDDAARLDGELKSLFESAPIDPQNVTLMGFSDGASYALSLGLANHGLFKWVAAFSPGFVMWPDHVAHSQRVFIAHGKSDQKLSFENTRDRIVGPLKKASVPVEFREFEGGHIMTLPLVREALKLATGCAREPAQ